MNLYLHSGDTVVCVQARPERSLSAAIRAAGIPLNTACGGRGLCDRCRVFLLEGSFEDRNGRTDVAPGSRVEVLSCAWRAVSDGARVEIPGSSLIEARAQVHEDFVLADVKPVPVTRRIGLSLPPVTPGGDDAGLERLEAALCRSLGEAPVQVPLSALRALADLPVETTADLSVVVGPDATGWTVCRVEAAPPRLMHLGVAVDVGTTTVVCALVDMDTGAVLGRRSGYNQQIRRADDVASRISSCLGDADVEEFRALVVEASLNPLIEELCRTVNQPAEAVVRIAVAGNTVMTHLLLGLSPAGIGVLPFSPVARRFPPLRAADLGLTAAREARVDVVPCVAGYIGGDIVADLLASDLQDRTPPALLVDIGTNGEIVLWDGTGLTAAATAAGPAFEGAGVRHGCRAAAGAIDHLRWTDEERFSWTVIAGGDPVGLCGSAMIDFIAESVRAGLIGETGRFDVERLARLGLDWTLEGTRGRERACVVVPASRSGLDGPLLVTERDVAEILKAKAAIMAGIRTLLDARGLGAENLSQVVLAGGFAHHIDLRNAMGMGLLPALPPDRYHVLGNGSLAGAFLSLQKPGARTAFDALAAGIRTIELNRVPGFEDCYIEALLLDIPPPGGGVSRA